MNTPKIQFLRIRFLNTALKSQHSLVGVVLQNRQEIDLLISEQGGTWAISNETCHFPVNTSKKYSDPTISQRMSWRVVRVAAISLWEIFLLASRNLELANAPTNPCYHHSDAVYDCSMYDQLSNPFCLCPWGLRLARLETSKRGRSNAPRHPSSAGSSQRDLDAPILKELGLPSLEGGMLGS